MEAFEDVLYPQKPFPLDVPRSKDMKVLALGLSRSGTDSLKQALNLLGYEHVYHGFDVATSEPPPARTWVRLARQKQGGIEAPSKAPRILDALLGHCEGVTDLPSAVFAEEIVAAYPKAKIILNYREDVGAWKTSMTKTLLSMWDTKEMQYLAFFHPRLYWRRAAFRWIMLPIFSGNPDRYGEIAYNDHCVKIRQLAAGREFLEWKVQDGWEPLCQFLGKPVPSTEFPSGNQPAAMLARAASYYTQTTRRAWLNLCFFVIGLAISGLTGYFRGVFSGTVATLASVVATTINIRHS